MLQRAVYIRNTYKFRLSWEYCLLDPMDLVTVTDTISGLCNAPIRITEIEEDDNGFLSVTAEEFPLGVATATLYADATGRQQPDQPERPADPVNAPIIFEPPSTLVGSTPRCGSRRRAARAASPIRIGAAAMLAVARRKLLQPDRHHHRAGAAGDADLSAGVVQRHKPRHRGYARGQSRRKRRRAVRAAARRTRRAAVPCASSVRSSCLMRPQP